MNMKKKSDWISSSCPEPIRINENWEPEKELVLSLTGIFSDFNSPELIKPPFMQYTTVQKIPLIRFFNVFEKKYFMLTKAAFILNKNTVVKYYYMLK